MNGGEIDEQTADRFTLVARELAASEVGDDASKVQQYLARYGYLKAAYELAQLDEPTSHGLGVFQKTTGPRGHGGADFRHRLRLEQPRCGVPDLPLVARAFSAVPPAFTLRGREGIGVVGFFHKSQFSGERGQSWRVEATLVRVEPIEFAGIGSLTRGAASRRRAPCLRTLR